MAVGSWKPGRGGSDGTVYMRNSFQDPHCREALARMHPFESTLGCGFPREGRTGQFGSRCAPSTNALCVLALEPAARLMFFFVRLRPSCSPTIPLILSVIPSFSRCQTPSPTASLPQSLSRAFSPLRSTLSFSQSPSRPGSDPGLGPLERSSPPPRRSSFPRPLSSSLIGGSLPFAHPRRPFAPTCHPACFHWSKRVHPASWSTRSSFA